MADYIYRHKRLSHIMRHIPFTKMQALGNDFVVLDCVRNRIDITTALILSIADRHTGIGCDQVLLLTSTHNPHADFGYRIFNADGVEVFQCGNGARCMGLFISQEKFNDKKINVLATKYDLLRVQCVENNGVQVDIAKPDFTPASLPFVTSNMTAPYSLQLQSHHITFDVVSVGNPHCVIQNNHFSAADMIAIGAQCNTHPAFPIGVNVGFVTVQSRDDIALCVYERGVGITAACGSGACAAVAVGRRNGALNAAVTVHQTGGDVRVVWESDDANIRLCGSATRVFDGVTCALA